MTYVESYCLAFAFHNGLRTCIYAMGVTEKWHPSTLAVLGSIKQRMQVQVIYGAIPPAISLSKEFGYWNTRKAVGLTC